MTNLERLKLELAHKSYFSDEEYTVFMEEQGLYATDEYKKETNQSALLRTVIAVLETLSNDINYYRTVESEFVTNTQAYTHLKNRIDELYENCPYSRLHTNCKPNYQYILHIRGVNTWTIYSQYLMIH